MVMFFTEEDIVSFGNYMLSQDRKDFVIEASQGESDEEIANRLKNVSNLDLGNWAKLVNTSPKF